MKRWLVPCVAAFALSGGTPDVAAEVTTHYSGHSCWRSAGESFDEQAFDANGLYNKSSTSLAVTCPMYWRGSSIDVEGATLSFTDNSSTGSVTCALVMQGPTNTAVTSTATSGSSSRGTGTFSFPNPFTSTWDVRTYAFSCTLPAKTTDGASYVRAYASRQVAP